VKQILDTDPTPGQWLGTRWTLSITAGRGNESANRSPRAARKLKQAKIEVQAAATHKKK
jgi:hypothetical protein